jgi:putative transcriptional regulator
VVRKERHMAKRHKIVDGLRDAISYANGDMSRGRTVRFKVPENVDVRAIREKLGLSQASFAIRYGFSLGTLRHWEQGLRRPEGSARVLLTVIAQHPKLVEKALKVVSDRKAVAVG